MRGFSDPSSAPDIQAFEADMIFNPSSDPLRGLSFSRKGRRTAAWRNCQVFSLYPVLKIHQIAVRQASMKPKVAATLRPTPTSETP